MGICYQYVSCVSVICSCLLAQFCTLLFMYVPRTAVTVFLSDFSTATQHLVVIYIGHSVYLSPA